MKIAVDKAQKDGKHTVKHSQIENDGHELIFLPLPVGDYILADDTIQEIIKRRGDKLKKMDLIGATKRSIDTKYGMEEIYGDIIGKSHERFRDECILAKNNGIKLYILVENEFVPIRVIKREAVISPYIPDLDHLHKYVNPRLFIMSQGRQKYPKATKGITLKKACITMKEKYGVEFIFCHGRDAGWAVTALLEGRYSEDAKKQREQEEAKREIKHFF